MGVIVFFKKGAGSIYTRKKINFTAAPSSQTKFPVTEQSQSIMLPIVCFTLGKVVILLKGFLLLCQQKAAHKTHSNVTDFLGKTSVGLLCTDVKAFSFFFALTQDTTWLSPPRLNSKLRGSTVITDDLC